MTPAARLSAAIGVLDEWLSGQPAEQALTRWARGARYAGSGDRAAVRDLVYDALRRKESAARLGGAEDGRGLILGLLRLGGEDPAEFFTGQGHAPAPLSASEAVSPEATAAPPDPACDIPGWLREAISVRAPDEAGRAALFAAMQARAPVWLRVARRRGDIAQAQASLRDDGIETRPDTHCATALEIISGARRLRGSAAYSSGLVELQDLSAQRAVEAVPWPAEGRILDYCAGGGGKALAIADRTAALLVAHDVSERRMADLPERAVRAGVEIRRVAPGEAATLAPCDAVLCDVPCSGSGTWRRDPEAKWLLSPDGLDALLTLQARILDEAALMVASGGLLVFMTCSLLKAENEDQVAAFQKRSPGWRLERMRIDTPLTASDGFFTAILRSAT